MREDLSKFDLFQLAKKLGLKITEIHSRQTSEGQRLHCRVNDKLMTCVQAREYLEKSYHKAKATFKI